MDSILVDAGKLFVLGSFAGHTISKVRRIIEEVGGKTTDDYTDDGIKYAIISPSIWAAHGTKGANRILRLIEAANKENWDAAMNDEEADEDTDPDLYRIWLCSIEWLQDCIKEEALLDPEDYDFERIEKYRRDAKSKIAAEERKKNGGFSKYKAGERRKLEVAARLEREVREAEEAIKAEERALAAEEQMKVYRKAQEEQAERQRVYLEERAIVQAQVYKAQEDRDMLASAARIRAGLAEAARRSQEATIAAARKVQQSNWEKQRQDALKKTEAAKIPTPTPVILKPVPSVPSVSKSAPSVPGASGSVYRRLSGMFGYNISSNSGGSGTKVGSLSVPTPSSSSLVQPKPTVSLGSKTGSSNGVKPVQSGFAKFASSNLKSSSSIVISDSEDDEPIRPKKRPFSSNPEMVILSDSDDDVPLVQRVKDNLPLAKRVKKL